MVTVAVLESLGDVWRNTLNLTYLRRVTSEEEIPPENEKTHTQSRLLTDLFINMLLFSSVLSRKGCCSWCKCSLITVAPKM